MTRLVIDREQFSAKEELALYDSNGIEKEISFWYNKCLTN